MVTATEVPLRTFIGTKSDTKVLPADAVADCLPPKVRYRLVPGSTSRVVPVDSEMAAREIV